MPESQPVTIVGAGVIGSALAWLLAKRGIRVTLLEAERVAAGASGGPGRRGVRGNGRALADLPLAARSLNLWPRLADDIQSDAGFRRTGSLRLYEEYVTANDGGYVSAPAIVGVQNAFGVRSQVVTRSELMDMEPGVSESLLGAVYCPDDGTVDHTLATRSLCNAALTIGAKLHENARVSQLQARHGRISNVLTEDEQSYRVRGLLILLANPGVAGLIDSIGVPRLPVWTMRPQMLFARPTQPVAVNHLLGHDSRRLSVKQLQPDMLMISGGWSGESCVANVDSERLRDNAKKNYAEATTALPALAQGGSVDLDASRVESITPDHQPIIDRIPGIENAIFATGWCGHGYAISLAVVEHLARWIESGRRPRPFAPFKLSRFGKYGSTAPTGIVPSDPVLAAGLNRSVETSS